MAKKQHDQETSIKVSKESLGDDSPELIAVESPDRDITPSDVPVREDPESEHLAVHTPQGRLQCGLAWYWRKKWYTIPATLIMLLAILAAIPMTRYGLTSWFWKEAVTITVTDTGNHQPVSEAAVTIGDQTLKTDKDGKAAFAAVPVGDRSVSIAKKYYETVTAAITVPWFAHGQNFDEQLKATGRQVDVSVANKVSGDVLANALISVGSEALGHTDDKGVAHLVIPADKAELAVTVTGDGYNATQATIKQTGKNDVQLVPVGRMFFLSKQSGAIDVVSTNLDGSDRKTIVKGTGSEDSNNTTLLASRDWKYLALLAKREAGKPAALYMIDTSKGTLEAVDQTNASFTLVGWSGHHFFYQIYRQDKKSTEDGTQAFKSYDADGRKLAMVDQTPAAINLGDSSWYQQNFGNFYITEKDIIYTRAWNRVGYAPSAPLPTDKTSDVVRVAPDGSGKKVLKSYPSQSISYIDARLYAPQDIYFRIVSDADKPTYAEFEDGTFHEGVNGDKYDSEYPTFLISPNGNQSFWSESRDGKQTLLIGDKEANNKQEIVSASDYRAYGWYTDGYLLLQKGGSELYITTAKQLKAGVPPLKVSDYHKPNGINGYGYGYGGQ